jgi:hypothetical protein
VSKATFGSSPGRKCKAKVCLLSDLNGNYFCCTPLGFDNIGHAAYNSHLHLVCQIVVVQTGTAKNQVHAFGFQRLE